MRISDWSSDVCSSDLRLLIYFLIGTAVVISCLLAAMMWFAMRAAAATREALHRETEQVEMRTILLRELNHRVKNTLATVNSLAALSREGATDVASYYADRKSTRLNSSH